MSDTGRSDVATATRLVWDLPVRIAHWLFVLCVAGSWLTHQAGVQWFGWHRRFGFATLVLVSFRIVWGFVGTRHARFANFLRGPRAVVVYLRRGGAEEPVGHNPLGALSVVALLALLLVQAVTGLFANDEIVNVGPFYGWVSPATSNRLTALHHANADWLLALIGLHIVAVGWYGLARRKPLLRAMVTGRKDAGRVPEGEGIAGSRTALAVAIAAAFAIALALAIRAAPEATIALF